MLRRRRVPLPTRRSAFCGLLVLAALGAIVCSALPGAGRQGVGSDHPYAYVVDVREYAGTGYGGESAHAVRVDLKFSQAGTSGGGSGSTGSTAATTGSTPSTTGTTTTGSTTGGTSPNPTGPQANASYAMVPHVAVMRPGAPTPGVPTIHVPPVASDFVNPAAWTSAHTNATQPGTTGSTTSTTGSTTSTAGSTTSGSTGGGGGVSNYFLAVDTAYASAFTRNGSTSNAITWTRYSGMSVTGYQVSSTNDVFSYRLSGAASRNVYVVVQWATQYQSYTSFYPATLALTRRDVPSVSIDSRRVYGQPDLDGEIPADPNADLRNPSFKDWVYKGGLFVGNAPPGTRDQSGTARVQGYVPPASFTYPLMASYTLLALGHPGGTAFANAAPYSAFLPSSSDPNLGTTTATVTWANKWDLGSATAAGMDEGYGSLPPLEYSRMVVPYDASGIGIALQGEDGVVSNGTATWQYFANAGYALAPDPAPRVWTLDRTSNDGGWTWVGAGWGYTGP